MLLAAATHVYQATTLGKLGITAGAMIVFGFLACVIAIVIDDGEEPTPTTTAVFALGTLACWLGAALVAGCGLYWVWVVA